MRSEPTLQYQRIGRRHVSVRWCFRKGRWTKKDFAHFLWLFRSMYILFQNLLITKYRYNRRYGMHRVRSRRISSSVQRTTKRSGRGEIDRGHGPFRRVVGRRIRGHHRCGRNQRNGSSSILPWRNVLQGHATLRRHLHQLWHRMIFQRRRENVGVALGLSSCRVKGIPLLERQQVTKSRPTTFTR